MKRLKFLLEKSGAYATILGTKLAKQQEQAREKAAQIDTDTVLPVETQQDKNHGKTRKTRASNAKRKTTDADYQLTDYLKEDVNVETNLKKRSRYKY